MDETGKEMIVGIIILLIVSVFFIPTFIAFIRKHQFKWIIFGINLIFGATGIGFLAAFAWAVWPRQTSVVDLIKNDPTDNSLEACKQYYQKRGEIDRVYDQARHGGDQRPRIMQAPSLLGPPLVPATESLTQVSNKDNLQKTCPFCGELINGRAIKCKHCFSILVA